MPVSNESGSDPAFPSNVIVQVVGSPVTTGNPLPVAGTVIATNAALSSLQFDGANNLKVNIATGGATASNTVAATVAGTTATAANPVQGVAGGVAMPVSVASLPLPTGASQDGSDATGVTAPAGGSGLRGWLSGMYSKLSGLSFDASNNLKVNIVTGGGAGGSSNTVAATSAGTTATTANPIQGVTGGVAMPISGTVTVTSSGSVATPSITQLSDGATPSQKVAISAAGALKVDNSAVTQPVSNASLTNLQFDASNNLKVNIITGGGAGGTSNTVAATAAGTTATTANPIQGVTGGVAMPVSAASLPLPTGASQDGVDATGVTAPAGGSGLRGWLSGMYQKLSGLSFDGSNNLKVNIIAGGGSSNTVVATAAGTTATTANPIQGVTGGVAMPVSGTVSITGSVATTSSSATAAGTTATTANPIQGVTGGVAVPVSGTITALSSVNGSVVSASNPFPTNYPIIGIGILTLLPTASVGTPPPLATVPTGAIGFRLYLPTGASVSGVFATSQANANTAAAVANGTATYSNTATGAIVDENLGAGLNFYVTATAGSPLFRWI